MKSREESKIVSFKCDAVIAEAIERTAGRMEMDRSKIIRTAISFMLDLEDFVLDNLGFLARVYKVPPSKILQYGFLVWLAQQDAKANVKGITERSIPETVEKIHPRILYTQLRQEFEREYKNESAKE